MTIGEYIKQNREKMGWSQRELSRRSGLSNQTISNYEKGYNPSTGEEITPDMKSLKRIAAAFGTDLQDMLKEVDDGLIDADREHPTMSFMRISQPFAQSVIDSFREHLKPKTPKEDAEMVVLWRNATPAAKRAAIAVLKSMEEWKQ